MSGHEEGQQFEAVLGTVERTPIEMIREAVVRAAVADAFGSDMRSGGITLHEAGRLSVTQAVEALGGVSKEVYSLEKDAGSELYLTRAKAAFKLHALGLRELPEEFR